MNEARLNKSIYLQNGIRDMAANIVEIMVNAVRGKGGYSGFHVICFVVDGQVEAALNCSETK